MRVAQGGGGLRKSGAPRVCLTEGCGVQVRGERTCRTCYQKARYTANEAKIRAKRKGHGNDRTRGTRAALQSIVSLTMSTVRRNEARLNQLEAFLGIHVPALQQDVRSIQLVESSACKGGTGRKDPWGIVSRNPSRCLLRQGHFGHPAANCGVQMRLSRFIALRMVSSFRMQATRATMGTLPA